MNRMSASPGTAAAPASRLRPRRARSTRRPRAPAALALTATVLASLAGLGPVSAATHEPASGPKAVRTELDAAVYDVVAAGVPGIIVGVQDGDRSVRLSTAGVSDLKTDAALRPGARFRIGSITKTFVATAVLQLVGEGSLNLDEPVARRLPGLLAEGEQVTVRQLLNHTSGLPEYAADPELFAGVVENRIWKPRELVALAEKQPQLLFEPGSAWMYSNTNYIVAGLLVEAVTGRSLARELDRRIFGPLRLRQTSFPATAARLSGYHAHGYISTEVNPTADGEPLDVTGYNPSHAWAAGAIVSNAADLSTFYRGLLSGRLLEPRLLREMKRTVAEDPADPQRTFSYGLGLERISDACGATWGHRGTIHGYQSSASWNERTGRTVVITSTMFPAPAAAEAPLATATDLALCHTTSTSSQPHVRELPHGREGNPAPALQTRWALGGAFIRG
jgi:D-alanyl-D-alanine carboxypeptidase